MENNKIVEYIKENIEFTSKKTMCEFLNIHRRTLHKIIKENNISDDRNYRYCPSCGEKIFHINSKERERGEGRNCFKCGRYDMSGENNPFFGKHHTEEMKKFYSEIHKGKRYSPSTEFKKGSLGNPVSNYETWTKKYGSEIANEKLESFRKKISLNNSGDKNPMYGRPAPNGSGNGWSGWYRGWYFRSLQELSYRIYVIDRFNLKWEPGESRKNSIQYIYDGIDRNYFPDFIIGGKYMIECKPKKLQKVGINIIKMEYAKKYCDSNGLVLKIRDCRKIDIQDLINLYLSGEIVLIEKYKNKIDRIIEKQHCK